MIHRDEVHQQIVELLENTQELSYDQAMVCLNQLFISLYKHFNESVYSLQKEANEFKELAYSLTVYETIKEIFDRFNLICLVICEKLEAKSKNQHMEIIEEIKNYVSSYYMKPELSLEGLAERFQLTPGYLGKLYKVYCHISFNDYLKKCPTRKGEGATN